MKFCGSFVVARFLAFTFVVTSAAAGSDPAVAQAKAVALQIESYLGGTGDDGPSLPTVEEFGDAVRGLRAYLDAHPEDVPALLTATRISMSSWLFRDNASVPPLGTPREYVDRALALQPDDAEVNLWHASVLVGEASLPADAPRNTRPNFDKAIQASRRAVELAPEDDRYRETLAVFLIHDQQPKEAMKVLAPLRDGNHPVYLLLRDFDSFPLPRTAAFDMEKANEYAMEQSMKGRIADHVEVRARVYVIPATPNEIETFYKSHFPSFRLGKPHSTEEHENTRADIYVFHFDRTADGWKPSAIKRGGPDPTDGMMVGLVAFQNATPEMRAETPAPVGESYCVLSLENLRPVKP